MQYQAFFSYARGDDKVANWLHRQLDSYRTPASLVGADGALGPVPAKLHPIFLDRTDLEAGGQIDGVLQRALEASKTLVVLCTPASAKSRWVNHECETFIRLGRTTHIFPVIADGEPDSGDPETECFPPALRAKGLLAADLREIRKPSGQMIGDGREGGRLKLIAGLLGVPLDQLVRRERRRQRLITAGLVAAAAILAVSAVTASYFAIVATSRARSIELQAAELAAEAATARLNDGDVDGALLLLLDASKVHSEGSAPDRLLLAFDDALLRAATQETIPFPLGLEIPSSTDGVLSPGQAAQLFRDISEDPQLQRAADRLASSSRRPCDQLRADHRFDAQLRQVLPADGRDSWVADAMCTSVGSALLVDYLSCGGAGGVCFRSFSLVGQEHLSAPLTDVAGAVDLIEYVSQSFDSYVAGRRRGDYAHPSEIALDPVSGVLAVASERDLLVIDRNSFGAREWRFPGVIQHLWMLHDGRVALIEASNAALHIIDARQVDRYGTMLMAEGRSGPRSATSTGLVDGVENDIGPMAEPAVLGNYRSDGLSIEHCGNQQTYCRTLYRGANGIESFTIDRAERFIFISETRPGRFLGGKIYSIRAGRVWRTFGPEYRSWSRVEFDADAVIVQDFAISYPTLSRVRRDAIAELTPGCRPTRRGDYASSSCWRMASER